MRVRHILGVLSTLAVTAGLTAVAPTAAYAHPPGTHDRDVLAQPAIVYIETSAQADVVLHAGGLSRASFDVPVLASGSGAVVNGNGTVITTGGVVSPDLNRAKVYAVNRTFAKHFGVPLPANPFARQRLSDPQLNAKLQGCYTPDRPTSDCAVFLTPRVRVFPFLATTPPGIVAEVLRAGRGANDVAVLSVSSSNMPTVGVTQTLKGVEAVSTLGFAQRPTAASTPAIANPHLAPPGTTKLTAKDVAAVRKVLPNPQGAVVIDAKSGSTAGLLGSGASPTIIPAETVNQALRSLGIQPARSVVDTDFASAHSFFAGSHFSHAVPRLQEVLRLYPGHALAARELQVAVEKKGTKADLSESEGDHTGHEAAPASEPRSEGANLVLLYAGLGLLALALVLAFVFGRRVSAGRLRLGGLGTLGARLGRLRLGRFHLGRFHLGRGPAAGRPGGKTAEHPPPAPTTGPRTAGRPGDGGAPAPGRAARPAPDTVVGKAEAPAGAPKRRESADLTVQRPRVVIPDGGVAAAPAAVPEQAPREGARASSPPRPAPTPGVATTATRAQFCTQCGMKMAPEHKFCGFCGHDAGR